MPRSSRALCTQDGLVCVLSSATPLRWADAAEACAMFPGGTLAGPAHARVAFEHAVAMGVASTWIGLNDRAAEGLFATSGLIERSGPVGWARGQPDDGGRGAASEDCVAVASVTEPRPPRVIAISCDEEEAVEAEYGAWSDEDCESARPFTCAFPRRP